MKLTATPAKDVFVRDEPVTLTLVFENDSQPRDFPCEPNVLDLLNFELLDEDGRVIRQANGYTWEERLGNEVLPQDPAGLARTRLLAGGQVEWGEDLLAYIGILEPGRYRARIHFCYPPAQIDTWSAPVGFTVVAPHLTRVDLVADQVAVPILHTLQLYEGGPGRSGGLAHFRLASRPEVHWEGQVFPGDPRADWNAAVADFTAFDSFDHDYGRWWAAAVGGELHAVRIVCRTDPIQVIVATGLPGLRFFARPIQRRDGGCSVLLASLGGDGRVAIYRVRLDAAGRVTDGPDVVGHLAAGTPASSGAARDGSIVVVTSGEDGVPEALVRVSETRCVERPLKLAESLPGTIRGFTALHAVRIDTRRRRPGGDRLQLTGTIATPSGLALWAAWTDLDTARGPAAWSHVRVPARDLPLPAGDPVTWSDSLLDRDGSPHLLASSGAGRCVLWSEAGGPQIVTEAGPHLPRMPRLVDCGGHLHVADARAVEGLRFYRPVG
jgi:hypothetical protein